MRIFLASLIPLHNQYYNSSRTRRVLTDLEFSMILTETRDKASMNSHSTKSLSSHSGPSADTCACRKLRTQTVSCSGSTMVDSTSISTKLASDSFGPY